MALPYQVQEKIWNRANKIAISPQAATDPDPATATATTTKKTGDNGGKKVSRAS